ncbi:MAG: aminoglycoside phosphotransferase family protein [Nocardioidaceae bacterium]
MGELIVPARLVESSMRDPSEARRTWLRALPEVVTDLAARWSLRLGEPYQPGGQCSLVAPVRRPNGERLVLKVGWAHTEARDEAEALRAWDGGGAVRLYAAEVRGHTSALLLEHCDPGVGLDQRASEPEQDVVVAGILGRLWTAPFDGHPFRPLQELCDQWAAEVEQRLAEDPGRMDAGLVREGVALFRAMPSGAERDVLLSTDLHAQNILAARRHPWLAIDPKPYRGDPTFDVLQHLLNCPGRLTRSAPALVARIADLLALDRDRLGRWLFARCVQESLDQPWLLQVARQVGG